MLPSEQHSASSPKVNDPVLTNDQVEDLMEFLTHHPVITKGDVMAYLDDLSEGED